MKSKNKNFKNTVSFKLNVLISATLIIIFTIFTIYSSYKNYNDAIELSKTLVQKEAKEFGLMVEKTFVKNHSSIKELYNTVNNHIYLSRAERNRSQIAKTVKNIVEDNQDVLVAGVYFEPNAFDGLDKDKIGSKYANSNGRFAVIAYRNGSEIKEASSDNVDDSQKNQFYTNAINSDSLLITEPIFDDLDGKRVLTYNYTIPIKEDGKKIGIVLCGVSIDGFQAKILEYKGHFDKTYFILNSALGSMVAHGTKAENRMKNILKLHPKWQNNFDKVQNGECSDVIEYSNTTKQDNVYTFAPVNIEGTNDKWVIQSATPLKYFVADARHQMYLNIFTYIMILILLIVLIAVLVRKIISNPLSRIESAMNKIASYNLDTEDERKYLAKYINKNDEIGEITRAIRLMVTNLKAIVENITSYASNTAATAEELTATAQSTNESAKEVANAVGNIARGILKNLERYLNTRKYLYI